jgi:hypothetical protein
LLDAPTFKRKVIYLVYRDPRDQFAELVAHSARTLPSMVNFFIREYRANAERVQAIVSDLRAESATTVHLIPFEEFVCSDELRNRLAVEVSEALTEIGIESTHVASGFKADLSRRNIGLWKAAVLHRPMRRIAAALPGYLRPEAD